MFIWPIREENGSHIFLLPATSATHWPQTCCFSAFSLHLSGLCAPNVTVFGFQEQVCRSVAKIMQRVPYTFRPDEMMLCQHLTLPWHISAELDIDMSILITDSMRILPVFPLLFSLPPFSFCVFFFKQKNLLLQKAASVKTAEHKLTERPVHISSLPRAAGDREVPT